MGKLLQLVLCKQVIFFGETAIITHEPRNATVQVTSDTAIVLSLSKFVGILLNWYSKSFITALSCATTKTFPCLSCNISPTELPLCT